MEIAEHRMMTVQCFCQNCGAKLEGRAGGNQNQQWQQNIDYSYQNENSWAGFKFREKKKGKLKILIPAIAVSSCCVDFDI